MFKGLQKQTLFYYFKYMTKEEVFEICIQSRNGVILQEKNFKKHWPDIYQEVLDFSKEKILFIQKLYNYFHDLKTSPLTVCGKKKIFRNFKYGYNDFCSSNCKCMVEHSNKKRIETSMAKYGVNNPVQSENVKNKISKTKLNYSQEKKDEIANKKRKTLKEHYGDDYGKVIENRLYKKYSIKNVSQLPGVTEKTKKTHDERYGGMGFGSIELREKGRLTNEKRNGNKVFNNKEKSRKTCFEKYGKENYFETDEFKGKYMMTCLDKYGVDNPSKSEQVKNKISAKNKQYRMNQTLLNNKDILEVKENSFVVECDENCSCGGKFEIPKYVYFRRTRLGIEKCIVKNPIKKYAELENTLIEYVKSIYGGKILVHDRKTLSGKEIDIYLPEIKIGFEFNGDYWHSNPLFYDYKDKKNIENWEKDMSKEYQANLSGISLYRVWEHYWLENSTETKRWIKNIIDNKTKYFSEYFVLKQFMDEQHFEEKSFGFFERDNIKVKYLKSFYCISMSKKMFSNDIIYVYDFEIREKLDLVKNKILKNQSLGKIKTMYQCNIDFEHDGIKLIKGDVFETKKFSKDVISLLEDKYVISKFFIKI